MLPIHDLRLTGADWKGGNKYHFSSKPLYPYDVNSLDLRDHTTRRTCIILASLNGKEKGHALPLLCPACKFVAILDESMD